MPAPQPPRLNKHGREIWFKEADGESGYGPVHRKGWMAFVFALLWISFSAGVGMLMVVLWALADVPLLIAVTVPFIVVTPGLLLMARTVRRHS